jgi:flagellar biosynthesis/type III secretory pathway M-ring protein FliF/YscJ
VEVAAAVAVLAALVAYVVTRPLLRARHDEREGDERQELEAAKEAKYREIREAELDFRMGKLSEDDYRATDRELRAQAIEILKRLDELEPR